MDQKTMDFAKAFSRIERQFTSANSVEVDRAHVRREDWEAIKPELFHKELPDHYKVGTSSFLKVLRRFHNTLCLFDGIDLVRLIGYEEDEQDAYFKVIVADKNSPGAGKEVLLTCVGSLHPLISSLPESVYQRMEQNLASASEYGNIDLRPVSKDFEIKTYGDPQLEGQIFDLIQSNMHLPPEALENMVYHEFRSVPRGHLDYVINCLKNRAIPHFTHVESSESDTTS